MFEFDFKDRQKIMAKTMIGAYLITLIASLILTIGMPGGWIGTVVFIGLFLGLYFYPVNYPVDEVLVVSSVGIFVTKGILSLALFSTAGVDIPVVVKMLLGVIVALVIGYLFYYKHDIAMISDDREAPNVREAYKRKLMISSGASAVIAFFVSIFAKPTDNFFGILGDIVIIAIFIGSIKLVYGTVSGERKARRRAKRQMERDMKEQMEEQKMKEKIRRKYDKKDAKKRGGMNGGGY